jgi:hypothetical protein
MKQIKVMHCATLALLASMGCSAGHDDDWNDANAGVVESDAPAAANGEELARLEFDDGNVVRFEALNDGVLVSETRGGSCRAWA